MTKIQSLLDKWDIDLKKYESHFDRELMRKLLYSYKVNHGIPSYRKLAEVFGVSRSTLVHLKTTTSPLATEVAISYMDKMGIDPKRHLVKRTGKEERTALERWGIDLEDYEKQVDREDIISLIHKHAKDKGFKTLTDIARDLKVASGALREFMENTAPVRSLVAVEYLDRLGIDPKTLLKPRNTEKTPKSLRCKFLSTFKADEERQLMIEHADEIRSLIAKYKNV